MPEKDGALQAQKKIEPVSFSPGRDSRTSSQDNQRISSTNRILTGGLLVVLGLMTLFVLNWAPEESLYTPTQPVSDSGNLDSQAESTTPDDSMSVPAETPWSDALLEQFRAQSQDLLAQLLPLNTLLTEREVTDWAGEDFTAISTLVEEADRNYALQRFEPALGGYREALDKTQQLVDTIPERVQREIETGEERLESGDAESANAAFSRALQMNPASAEAINGVERAKKLPEVFDLIDEARLEESAGNFPRARELLNSAQIIDPQLELISEFTRQLDEQIAEQRYQAAMTRGFRSLESRRYSAAQNAFEEAIGVRPNDPAALLGLEQVSAQEQISEVSSKLTQARNSEIAEFWQAANNIYNELLSVDESLSEARLGQIRTRARLVLDNNIEDTLNQPLAVQDEQKWRAASELLEEARAIKGPGPRLLEQIQSLSSLLREARIPRTIYLNSDGMTAVEIYKLGKLGQFTQQVIELVPGNYVAVGTRSGYRDVRVEFSVPMADQSIELVVSATEPINR